MFLRSRVHPSFAGASLWVFPQSEPIVLTADLIPRTAGAAKLNFRPRVVAIQASGRFQGGPKSAADWLNTRVLISMFVSSAWGW